VLDMEVIDRGDFQ